MAKIALNAAKSPKLKTLNMKLCSPGTIVVTNKFTVSFKTDVILRMPR